MNQPFLPSFNSSLGYKVILTVVIFFPLFSLRKGQASTLRSPREAVIICSSLDVDRKKSHWNEAVRAGASAFVRLATKTTSGSVILAFKIMPMQDTQEMQVQSLGQEDPLEKEMAIHPGIVA